MRKVTTFNCPCCKKKYQSLATWATHVQKQHPGEIPSNMTPAQYFYFLQTGKDRGSCIVCKRPTKWNEGSKKYERFCSDPVCKQVYREEFKKRMIGKYGKVSLLDDPDQQRKMLEGRKNSQYYTFEDGTKILYSSSYEKHFLQMLDTFLDFNGSDILGPSPHTYTYQYTNPNDVEHEGEKFYIPDYFIPSLNLEVEIKQNTSTHPKILAIDKVKEAQKDKVMESLSNQIRYIKITDKDYSGFYTLLLNLQKELPSGRKEDKNIYAVESVANPTPVEPHMEIANEGLLDFLSVFGKKFAPKSAASIIETWKEAIFQGSQLMGPPQATKYLMTSKKVIVDNKRGIISIQKINIQQLITRIRDLYEEKRLDYIFDRTYPSHQIARFKKKKISRSQMKITSLTTPVFFALELTIIFKDLYKRYKTPLYSYLANEIYKHSWLSQADRADPRASVDFGRLNRILNPKYTLKNYQTEFIELYPKLKTKMNLRGYYLAFDQGLGKTLTASSLAMALGANKLYIVCPNTLLAVWKTEIEAYFDRKLKVVICNKPSGLDRNASVYVVNNESIKNMLPYVDSSTKSILIVDEAHNFRNYTGSRVMELLDLREKLKPADVLLMSGTPLKATPNEMVPALLLLDPLFTKEAAEIYNKCFKFDSYMAMDIVRDRFGNLIYRKTKAEVLELPDKQVEDLHVKIKNPDPFFLTNIRAEVMEFYAKFAPDVIKGNESILQNFIEYVKRYSTASDSRTSWYLKRVARISNPETDDSLEQLHEIDQDRMQTFLQDFVLSNPSIPESIKKQLPDMETKLQRYDRVIMGKAIGAVYPRRRTELFTALYSENKEFFVEKITSNVNKTVIFSQFLPVVSYIADDLNASGIKTVKIVGGVNASLRSDIINQFKYDEDTRVIIATSQTMGTGVTLTEADQMFFFGPPWRSADYDQCCDRIHRIGQENNVHIYNVLLDSPTYNLSARMDKILKWSGDMFHSAIDAGSIATESEMGMPSEQDTALDLLEGYLKSEQFDRIWLASDWHGNIEGKQITDLESLFQAQNQLVDPQDVFVFLGDLYDQKTLKGIPSVPLKGRCILIRGNHDELDDSVYTKMGFELIRRRIETDDYLFTHMPEDVSESKKLNIHGHYHGLANRHDIYRNIDADRHVDCYLKLTAEKPVVTLRDILNYYPEYQKHYADGVSRYNAVQESFLHPKANDKVLVSDLTDLVKRCSKFTYGYKTQTGQMSTDISKMESTFCLMSPAEVGQHRMGTCWDMTEYFHDQLHKKYGTFHYLIEMEAGKTHTFTVVLCADGCWYPEAAYGRLAGVWKESNLVAVISKVTKAMFRDLNKRCGFTVYRYTPAIHTHAGMTAKQFLDSIRNGSRLIMWQP